MHAGQLPDRSTTVLGQERMPPGTAEGRHAHGTARQFLHVLSGSVTVAHGEGCTVLERGQGVEIAPGMFHRIRNDREQATEFLVVSAPPSQHDRIPDPGDARVAEHAEPMT